MKPSESKSSPAAPVRQMSPQAFTAAHPPPRLIDVREPDEFVGELGHVPRAELVPLGTLPGAARDWNRDETLVVICRSGARSAKAVALLREQGFRDVWNLDGGTQAYVKAGLPVER